MELFFTKLLHKMGHQATSIGPNGPMGPFKEPKQLMSGHVVGFHEILFKYEIAFSAFVIVEQSEF